MELYCKISKEISTRKSLKQIQKIIDEWFQSIFFSVIS